MEGWIKLHRQIKEHWIWKDPVKFQWWIDILLSVNHDDAKVNIGYEIYECKRGQSIMSLKSWAENWKVSKDTVRNFFKLLAKDNMIILESLTKSTRITVCNYDTYQYYLHDEQTQPVRKANDEQTQPHSNKNDKKEKNDKNNNKFFDLSFVDPLFNETFLLWLNYKKEKREGYKSQKSLEIAYHKLIKDSGSSPIVAKEMIETAITNSWKGFFPIKNKELPSAQINHPFINFKNENHYDKF